MTLQTIAEFAGIVVPVLTIIGGTVALIVISTKLSDRVTATEKDIVSIKADVKDLSPVLLRIQTDIAEIKTTLKIHFKQ